MGNGKIILYTAEDGTATIHLKAEEGTVWLTQAEIATLFQTTPQNITLHIKAIYEEAELTEVATCKELLQVRFEGVREIRRTLKSYNLNMILAIGYRVRSHRGTQFRQWATTHLQEYLVKGFVMNDARLKEPAADDYFIEWLERIRRSGLRRSGFIKKYGIFMPPQLTMIRRTIKLSCFSKEYRIRCYGPQRITLLLN